MAECDLCNLPKDQPNEACPQHRMWRLQAEVEQMRPVVEMAIEYVQHQQAAMLVGVPPLTSEAYTKRRMELRGGLHYAVAAYLVAAEAAGGE